MNKQGNRRSLKWLALLAAVSLFVWLAYKTGLSKIVLAVQQMGAGFLLLVLISAARHAFRTVAWQNCIRPGQRKLSWIHLFNIRLAGEAVADLTFLGPLLGETVRIVTASKRLSAPDSLSSVVMEDLLYSFSLFLFMPGGLFILIPTLAVPSQIKFASILLTLALFLPVLAAYALVRNRWALLDRLLDRLRKVDGRWNVLVQNRDKVDLFKENIYGFYSKRTRAFYGTLLLELLASLTGVIEAYVILRATTGRGSLLAAYVTEAANRVVNMAFAFVPLRVGVDEGATGLILAAAGYTLAAGVSLAIVRKIRSLFWVGIGLVMLARVPARRSEKQGKRCLGEPRLEGRMKRLIANADDFGLTEKINLAIVQGHQRGIITSTSLLANVEGFDSAVALAQKHPRLGVGVHLNLTEGKPVSTASSVSSLVDNRGLFFSGPFAVATRILARQVSLADLEREFRAQIEKVLTAGVEITHLDSHQHIHLLPPVFDVVIRLACEYRVNCVRCPVERCTSLRGLIRRNRPAAWPGILKQHLLGRALSSLAATQQRKLESAGLSCATYFYGISHTGFLGRRSLEEILRGLPDGTSEIMCHPGYVDASLLRTSTRLLQQRVRELHALTRPEIPNLVVELGIELITHRQLVGVVVESYAVGRSKSGGALRREFAGNTSLGER